MKKLIGSAFFAAALAFLPACGAPAKGPATGNNTTTTTSATGGETISHASAHISIELPAGWTSESDKDSLTVADPAEEVVVIFIVVPVGAVKETANALGENLSKNVDNLKLGEGEDITINGMAGKVIEGDGTVKEMNVDILVAIVDTPADDKDLMIVAIAEDAKLSRHKSEVRYLFEHLKPN